MAKNMLIRCRTGHVFIAYSLIVMGKLDIDKNMQQWRNSNDASIGY